MKKFFLMMTAALALSLVSCNGNKDYKAEGQELSKQLDEVVEKNDTAAALTTDESIREMEQEIVALGDSAALADFRAAMKDSRIRNAAFVTVGKIRNGMDKNEALNELVQDALDEDIDVNAITAAVNAILAAEMKQNTKKAEK
jgi:hypothetical protein